MDRLKPNHIYLEPLLRAKDVAKILDISESYAYRLFQSGEIPSVHFNRSVRVRPKDIQDFIDKHRENNR